MTSLEAFIIGALQGLTEFLPISSSAHMKLAKLFFGIEAKESQIVFDLVCHLGTLIATLYFLRKEILELKADRKKLQLLLISLIPLIPCYFLLKPLRIFASQPQFLGIALTATAAILFIGQKLRFKTSETPSFKNKVRDVLWIGSMQGAALIPGISRSASTISTAHVLGWSPREAVRVSFLLSIPTIIGGNSLEFLRLFLSSETPVFSLSSCLIGFISSCSVGLIAIRYSLKFLEKGNLKPFAWYCLILGIITTLYLNL